MTNPPIHDTPAYDEALLRLEPYGTSRFNGFTSHAPMVVEALCQMRREDAIGKFLDAYLPGLQKAYPSEPAIDRQSLPLALGRERSYERWLSTFRAEISERGVRSVAESWLPRLTPGCVAAAFHGPLMTAHALRGVEVRETAPRLEAVARGMAYWASTFQRLSGRPTHGSEGTAMTDLIAVVPPAEGPRSGAIDAAVVERTQDNAAFIALIARCRKVEADPIAAMTAWGAQALLEYPSVTASIIFTHTVTGPVAFRTLGRWMPETVWEDAMDHLWQAFAAVFTTFTGPSALSRPPSAPTAVADTDEVIQAAIDTGDDHAIKLTEAALVESVVGGHRLPLAAAAEVCLRVRNG